MDIKTKFDLDQSVYVVDYDFLREEWVVLPGTIGSIRFEVTNDPHRSRQGIFYNLLPYSKMPGYRGPGASPTREHRIWFQEEDAKADAYRRQVEPRPEVKDDY